MGKAQEDVASLPLSNVEVSSKHNALEKPRHRSKLFGIASCLLLWLIWSNSWTGSLIPSGGQLKTGSSARCDQVPALYPKDTSDELVGMDKYLETAGFRNQSISKLSGAVRIPTESFDDLGPIGEDKRWEIMYKFADYLNETFPRVHQKLLLERVNTHGLLYTWIGEDETLKPTLLMAHQDVVPVPAATVDAWTHPPFSGFYDGQYIWGRGSSDCKNQLVGVLEAVEELIKAGFKPKRTVLLSFGFDEEVSGPQGAGHLGPFIYERYGTDGIAAIVDEGAGFTKAWGMQVALPGVGEKGYTDVHITIRMPGGHSSIPPDHTGIGVMSELITMVEANPYTTKLDDANPYLGLLTCGAEHGSKFPSKLKKLLHRREKSSHNCKAKKDHLAVEAAKAGPGIKYLMQTSVATDLIEGGVKVNALPERTTSIVNHRVNIGEHTADVHHKITKLAKIVADKYNLTLHAFDNHTETPSSITLYPGPNVLEPAPVSPTDVSSDTPWSVLAGTVRALYGEDVIVAPGLMTGNTDTRHYWNSSKHIFRFTSGWDGESAGLGNIHTVDERVAVKAHINMVRWMSLFIRNMDASDQS